MKLFQKHIHVTYKMLYYDRFNVFESIDVNKTSASNCIFFNCWYFQIKSFCQTAVCNGCQDVLMMYFDLSSITILNIHSEDYGCIINGISKIKARNLLRNADVT